ncbi:hypothetical protein AB4Y30_06060 [Ornithinibacillus sp. 4-3]|uniref:Lipoprotein n=1 Tax=Ornithinibacillus sp. 4-3 TaxID=3231488 RepID=A0AB39HNI3_9BACI
MKKLFVLLLLGLLSLVLVACSQKDMESNTIATSELTEREKAILSTTSDKSFVFDFNIDSEYEEITVWVEKFESGILVDDGLGHITTQAGENGSIIFTTSKNDNEKQNIFNIGISTDESTSSIIISDTALEEMASVWNHIPEEKSLANGEVVLANICYSDDENGMQSLTTDFYDDVDGHMGELAEYDVVYLLKAEFLK